MVILALLLFEPMLLLSTVVCKGARVVEDCTIVVDWTIEVDWTIVVDCTVLHKFVVQQSTSLNPMPGAPTLVGVHSFAHDLVVNFKSPILDLVVY